ncbi:MAG TPA: hypothetical protein VFI45_02835 [Candidatus Acidoferrum sp.]|nr:hypothetical protein [Candidatus Acidoferrum sp.]
MKYTKPEIIELGNPIDAIQTTQKIGPLEDNHPAPTGCSAYEADE